ncbi:TPA: hypothetical protein ACRNLD_002356 [Pseudomonas aeruginosa]
MNKALDLLREIRPSIPKEVLELWCKDRDAFLASHPAVEQAGGDERDFQAKGAQEVPSPVSKEYDRHLIGLLRKGEALPGHQEEAADEIERLRDWNDHLNNTVLPNILNPNFLMLMKGGERLLDLCTKDGKFIGVSLNDMKDVFDWMVTHARIAPDHAALAQPSPKCSTCGGTGMVDDGEIDCYSDGTPFENGPVKCVKDCPACKAQPSPAQAEQPTADDYEEVLADHRRLVREMDVLLNGEAYAAKQAMLCDLVSQVEAEVRKSGQPLLVSAERYRWLRNDDNWGADDSEGQGTSKWANLGELSGTDFDAYLDQLRGYNPVMDIDPEHSKAIAKRGRDAIVAQAEGAPVIGCLCGMPMTEGRHSPGGCTSLEEFAPHLSAQAQAKQAEQPEVVARVDGTDEDWFIQPEDETELHNEGLLFAGCELGRMIDFDRIVGALRAENAKLSEALDECDGDRWKLRSERDAANARLHEVATACATAEQERDAALARVAELEQKSAGSWTVDTSCGRPILMYEGCSVIEDQTAYEVIRMIKWIGELERQEPVATVAKVPGEDWNSLDFHRDLQHMQPGTKLYAAPVAQAQQLKDLDKQCRDDVARALGLRPNQERGFAWSYLLASIKSCVKASGDSAQAQHSVPDGWVQSLPLKDHQPCKSNEDRANGYVIPIYSRPVPVEEALRKLRAVLCDPVGNVVIDGSDGDREEVQRALGILAAAPGNSAQHSGPEGWKLVPIEPLLNMMSDKDHDTRITAERQLLSILADVPGNSAQHSVPEGWRIERSAERIVVMNMKNGAGYAAARDGESGIAESVLYLLAADLLAAAPGMEVPQAWLDVQAERRRQVEAEGWTPEHDDEHACDEIAAFACFYAMPPAARDWDTSSTGYGDTLGEAILPEGWEPKTGDRRREMVKACALTLAEIERLDRADAAGKEVGHE